MKKITATVLFVAAAAFCSNTVFADSIVATYNCKLKEGKKMEELQAANSNWLKWIHANVSKDIRSEVGTAVVGQQGIFLFADTYPDLTTWAAAQTALDGDAGQEIEGLFSEVSECTENRLWKFEPTP